MKELGVFKDRQIVGYLFLPPKKIQIIIPIFLVYKTSSWNQFEQQLQKIYCFEKLLENQEATETEFFAKSYEKGKILSEFLKTEIINLDDYACPKVQF